MKQSTDELLEALYVQYMESKGVDGEEVNSGYEKLYQRLQEFSRQKQNDVECAVNELCAIIERIAFLDGMRTGAMLVMELTK